VIGAATVVIERNVVDWVHAGLVDWGKGYATRSLWR